MAGLIALIAHALFLGTLMLLLHRLSPRFGFAPLLIMVGALTMMLQSQLGLFYEPLPGLVFFFSQVALIPVILSAVLVIYVAHGAGAARIVLLCIVGVSLLVLLLAQTYRWSLSLPGSQTTAPFTIGAAMSYIAFNPRIIIGSIIAFTFDMFVITIVYQGLRNLRPRIPETLLIGVALVAAFWTDYLVFSLVVDFGRPNFMAELPGGLLTKTIAALILWLPVAFYLTRIAPREASFVGGDNRPLFDIVLSSPGEIRMALDKAQTEREQAIAERQREYSYNQQIVNNIDEALWLADVNQEIIYFVNHAYERLWGRPASDFLGGKTGFESSLHPEDRERVIQGYAEHARGDYQVEYRIIRPDGTIRWMRDRVFPIRDENGAVIRFAGLTSDITALKQAENERLQLAVEQEKVRLLRDFVAEVTHDLKTPLSSIHIKLYQAMKTDDPARRSAILDEVQQQAERMGTMINDMLTLSRLESLTEMTLHRINLNDLVAAVSRELMAVARQKSISLRENLTNQPLAVLADKADLQRAIGNLVDNAIHYTPAGGVIHVETHRDERHASVIIRDNGIGIPDDDLANIFERFYRAANGRATDPGGTGLGLAIVKKVIESHHGNIEVSSRVGEGTTFVIRLPLMTNGAQHSSRES